MLSLIKQKIKSIPFVFSLIENVKFFISGTKKNISGFENKIGNRGVLKKVKITIQGNHNLIQIEEGVTLDGLEINMIGDNHRLIVGKNSHIIKGEIWFEDNNCSIQIGQDCFFKSPHIAVTEPDSYIKIGNNTGIGKDVEIRTGDSHSIIDLETKKRINYAQNIEIGDMVWIGVRAMIFKGVKISNNVIVSANAIVTSDVPSNVVVAGVPAKVVKTNVDWKWERIYDK